MDSCCQTKYQKVFDAAGAEKEMKAYLSKGVKKSSRPFVKALRSLPLAGQTLLDIGSGIGAVVFESFDKGLTRATYIDIAAAYREKFLQEARKRQLMDRIETRQGDFVDLYQQVDKADLVTLDKVICCYENFETLVQHSVSKARRWYVYSIPRDVWWVRLVHSLEGLVNVLWRKDFRSFIHPPAKIEAIVEAAGFNQVARYRQREWEVTVFEKSGLLA